ncbi:MAG: hypothetical protein AAGA56_03395 [Myxococcota bacterium]
MMTRFPRRAAVSLSIAVTVFAACDPLVGGDCRDGFDRVGSRCRPRGSLAVDGSPGGSWETATGDTDSTPVETGTGGRNGGAGGGDPVGTGGTSDVGGGSTTTGPGGGGTGLVCASPEINCGGTCVDTDTDPFHCGGCGVQCATGICTDGDCEGQIPGRVVALGLDYSATTSASARLLGNSIFIAPDNPVRILLYRDQATPSARSVVAATIQQQASSRGRSVNTTIVDSGPAARDALNAANFDVFLVHDQPGLTSTDAGALATTIELALIAHMQSGGVAVVLATSPSMATFLDTTGLLAVDAVTPAPTPPTLANLAPTDAVGINVPSPFLGLGQAASFDILPMVMASSNTVAVVEDTSTGDPVVVHRTY